MNMRLPEAVQAALGAEPPPQKPPLQAVCLQCAKVADWQEPKTAPAQGEVLKHLMKLRDEMARAASHGRFADAAACEWRMLPRSWRKDLITLAGLAPDELLLESLAGRDWHEIPPPERLRISGVVRGAKRHLSGLVALAARV